MAVISIFLLYVIIVNIVGFCAMGIDKHKAKKGSWRIPEKRLFFIALIGGSVGAIVGMRIFRHKTKHWYFVWGMPAILILQILAVFYVLFYSPLSQVIH